MERLDESGILLVKALLPKKRLHDRIGERVIIEIPDSDAPLQLGMERRSGQRGQHSQDRKFDSPADHVLLQRVKARIVVIRRDYKVADNGNA